MPIKLLPYDLAFKAPAGTSRGVLRTKRSWFLFEELEHGIAVGECGVFTGLSCDDHPDYESVLRQSVVDYEQGNLDLDALRNWPSIVCGWEIFLADKQSLGEKKVFDCTFADGKAIPINGLIWMGSKESMSAQIDEKLASGFSCIKLKIGAIDFDQELSLLQHIRSKYSADQIELRLDANGAFTPEEVLDKLERLSAYNIHSIEQPIKQGQWGQMAMACASTPIPIALDEELIGIHDPSKKKKLLEHIAPQYIILKPSLVGGFRGSDEWVSMASELNIPWWATSALESNIGLNAIAQWVSGKDNHLPQGLGTGQLYTNNIPSPLRVQKGALSYRQNERWDLSLLTDA